MKAEPVAKTPGLFRRGTVWWLRVMVPLDLQAAHEGRTKIVRSLGTSDRREAGRLADAKRAELGQSFEDLRRALNPRAIATITPELGQALAAGIRARFLRWDESIRGNPSLSEVWLEFSEAFSAPELSRLRIGGTRQRSPSKALESLAKRSPLDGLTPEQLGRLAEVNASWDGAAAAALASRRLSHVAPLADLEARRLGILVDWRTPEAREALLECLRAFRGAIADLGRRDRGDDVATPAEPPQSSATGPVRLRDVFLKWKAAKKRSEDSVKACERALEAVEAQTGNPPVGKITRAMGADFRAWLLTQPLSSKTAHDRLTWAKSLLRFAYRDLELIARQPWEGIDIEHATQQARRPWSQAQLQAFFSEPLFTSYALPDLVDAAADAAYWIPLLGLYTGARVGELCQLTPADVGSDAAGPTIRITNEAPNARVKTAAGHREVPIHSELVRLGFLDYVSAVRAGGGASLWPAMRFRKGKPGGNFSEWFAKARRAVPGGAPDFHSLRHTVRTALAEAGVDTKTKDRLTGHAPSGSTGTRVYEHVTAAAARKAIEALSYPGLRPPRVYRAPTRRPAMR